MIFDSIQVDEALLVLKVLFLSCSTCSSGGSCAAPAATCARPQESFILGPGSPEAMALARAPQPGRLVVVSSPVLQPGEDYELNAEPLTIGRGGQNDVQLPDDEFASARHARIEARQDGVWVEDIGSTNGTTVNGLKLTRPRRLSTGRPREGRRHRAEVRAVRVGAAPRRSAIPAASAGRTRTRTSASRRSSRSPTASAAPRPARSPRGSPRRALRDGEQGATGARGVRRRAHPGGEPPRLRPLERGLGRVRDGHDDDCRARRRRGRS